MTSRGDGEGAGVSDEACEGVKVVEFAAYAAGPVVGKNRRDPGATVFNGNRGGDQTVSEPTIHRTQTILRGSTDQALSPCATTASTRSRSILRRTVVSR